MTIKKGKGQFEEKLKELEGLVKKMEEGLIPLEESLDLFERGTKLSRELQEQLFAANLRVTKLIEGVGVTKEIPAPELDGEEP